ncbi:MAG TPA: zinc-dependent metalloprotease [Solirubrobacteraceae bacterium]
MTVIDWGLAAQAALWTGGDAGDATPLPGDVAATCDEAELRIAAYTGLHPVAPIPAPETVDRPAWVEANLSTMSEILDPVAERLGDGLGPLGGAARRVGGTVLGLEAGALTGYLGRKVLGQYDLRLLAEDPAPRLLIVAPNVREAAAALDVDLARLTQWVCVHEVTHAVQFGAVDWLRPHLAGLLRDLLSADVKIDALRLPSLDDLRGVVDAIREGSFVELVAGPERREQLDRLQAAMALIEGHAELVMDAVGEQLIGDLSDLRAALERRRNRIRPPLVVWLERLLGLELKLRQYEQGRRFCDGVIERSDVATLHLAFAAPENLPTLAELDDPAAWVERVRQNIRSVL